MRPCIHDCTKLVKLKKNFLYKRNKYLQNTDAFKKRCIIILKCWFAAQETFIKNCEKNIYISEGWYNTFSLAPNQH